MAKRDSPLAAVIFNAGSNLPVPFEKLTAEQFEEFWRIGCYGAFLTAKRALPILAAQGRGSLMFTGASASMRGRANFGHFASAKAALRNLAQAIAREYGPKGVHVAHVIIDGVVNPVESDYLGIDARLTYDLNKLIGQTAWFDPYLGVGLGYTDANNQPRSTYNAIVGFRTWFSDRWGLDFNSSGKWRTGDTGTNHIQHAAGVVYQFGIEKGLSKKGEEKLAMIQAMEAEKQRVNDSIAAADREREAAALAVRLAQEKEKAQLAAAEKAKMDAEKQREQAIRDKIEALGYVYFDLNSSYLNKKSQGILDALGVILEEYPELHLKVTSHTDSRGQSTYNKWLSERRVQRTVQYLTAAGIDPARLASEAFGEENLLNECDDNTYCTEEKHQVNRRSEFVIIKF